MVTVNLWHFIAISASFQILCGVIGFGWGFKAGRDRGFAEAAKFLSPKEQP